MKHGKKVLKLYTILEQKAFYGVILLRKLWILIVFLVTGSCSIKDIDYGRYCRCELKSLNGFIIYDTLYDDLSECEGWMLWCSNDKKELINR